MTNRTKGNLASIIEMTFLFHLLDALELKVVSDKFCISKVSSYYRNVAVKQLITC